MRHMVAVALALAGTVAGAASGPVTPQEAIVAAVVDRLGVSASVKVLDLETSVPAEPGLVAEPDGAARLARRARFVLTVGGVRRGLAVATVTVTAVYPRAARAIARDEEIGADALDVSTGELPDLPIRRMLDGEAVIGLTARRAIAAGEALTLSVLRMTPMVKSGDPVDATVRIGAVLVTGTGIASGSGQVGDMIRFAQPHSSRLLRARITGPGAVEIVE